MKNTFLKGGLCTCVFFSVINSVSAALAIDCLEFDKVYLNGVQVGSEYSAIDCRGANATGVEDGYFVGVNKVDISSKNNDSGTEIESYDLNINGKVVFSNKGIIEPFLVKDGEAKIFGYYTNELREKYILNVYGKEYHNVLVYDGIYIVGDDYGFSYEKDGERLLNINGEDIKNVSPFKYAGDYFYEMNKDNIKKEETSIKTEYNKDTGKNIVFFKGDKILEADTVSYYGYKSDKQCLYIAYKNEKKDFLQINDKVIELPQYYQIIESENHCVVYGYKEEETEEGHSYPIKENYYVYTINPLIKNLKKEKDIDIKKRVSKNHRNQIDRIVNKLERKELQVLKEKIPMIRKKYEKSSLTVKTKINNILNYIELKIKMKNFK